MNQDTEIEAIRKNANIVDIISSYISLTLKGKNYFGVCPFHEDHSPSMSVSEEKQIYKCFSCGASGNVFTFVKDYENVSFIEAVSIVAEKCGLNFHGTKKVSKVKKHETEYEIMNLALKFYQNNLNSALGSKAKEYLQKRSIDDKLINDFNLGLALDYNNSLNKLLTNKKYSIPTLLELGLINQNNEFITDVFQNRIIFPIHNLEGEVIGFTGRIYEDINQAKYINSKESVIFKKGQIIFNYHRALPYIKKQKEVIIVEGNVDAMRLYGNNVKNVLALMGTSLTKDQVSIIKNLRSKIILMLDNDEAGANATFTNGNILEEAGLSPLVVRLTGEKDPDEYILKNGISKIIENINHPLSFLDFKLTYLKNNKDLTKTEDLVKYIKDIVSNLKNINDDLTKEITLKKISEEYDIPLDLLEQELKKVETKTKKDSPPKKILEKPKLSKYNKASEGIIYFMINESSFIKIFKEDLGYFNNQTYRSIANEIIYYYEEYGQIDVASFISYISTKNYLYYEVINIIKNNNTENFTIEAFKEYLKVAQIEMYKDEIKELKEAIKNELDASKKLELANKLIELKKGCVENGK